MKCNMCHDGDMKHEYLLYHMRDDNVMIPRSAEAIKEVDASVMQGSPTHEGRRIVHIYNCSECPNAQVEYYIPEDARAFDIGMTDRNKSTIY